LNNSSNEIGPTRSSWERLCPQYEIIDEHS